MNLESTHPSPAAPALSLRKPADLLAAIPYLLGFWPRDSLVLLGTEADGPHVVFTLRVDLPPRGTPRGVLRTLAATVARQNCAAVFVALIGGARPKCAGAAPKVVRQLIQECRELGVHVRDVLWAAEVAKGAEWFRLGGRPESGTLPDPVESPLAARMAAAGEVTYADREELERMMAPGDPEVLRRRAELVNDRIDEALATEQDLPPHGREAVELLDRWLAEATRGQLRFTDEDVAAICLALSDPLVRDAAFGLAHFGDPKDAERLWTALLPEVPDPEAAEVAVLLAHTALLTGRHALIGVALDRALQAWPGHQIAVAFRAAVVAGYEPERLASWFAEGARGAVAELTGFDPTLN